MLTLRVDNGNSTIGYGKGNNIINSNQSFDLW